MVPKSDIERFIQAIIDDGDAPSAAKCRIEQYLTDILEERVSTLEPAFRIEYYLAKISGADVELPGPISRADLYLSALAGAEVTLPDTPNSSLEEYLARWCETGDVVSTLTGSIVHFTGRTNTTIRSLSVDLQPVQDLHGYDHPWPAGGGKNLISKAFPELTDYYGTTFTNNADGSVSATGTPTQNVYCEVSINLPAGTYVVSGAPNDSENGRNDILVQDINWTTIARDYNGATDEVRTFTLDTYTTGVKVRLRGKNGFPTNCTFYPMVRLSTATPDFSPYSNICPFTGRTGLNVYVSPTSNQADAAVYNEEWTSAAGTVYAGSYNAVSGKLKARPEYPAYNGETLIGPWMSSMDIYTPGGTPTTGAQVVDFGGTETEYTLTPRLPAALLGPNNIWSDAGDVTVAIKGGFTN